MSEVFTGYPGPTFSFAQADLDTADFLHSTYLV